jgi:hypothetical protein
MFSSLSNAVGSIGSAASEIGREGAAKLRAAAELAPMPAAIAYRMQTAPSTSAAVGEARVGLKGFNKRFGKITL